MAEIAQTAVPVPALPLPDPDLTPMRSVTRYFSLPLFLAVMAGGAHADEWNQYRIKGNLFNDYRPAHQRANPGEKWEQTKQRERDRIDRESEQRRSHASRGTIDNRDYSRSSRKSDDRMRYHSPDRNRHRVSGIVDNRTYGTTPYRAPAGKTAHQWTGPDDAAENTNRHQTGTNRAPAAYSKDTWQAPLSRPYKNPYAGNRTDQSPEKYYGARSGESLYPYTAKPVKGTWAADTAQNKNNKTPPASAKAAYTAAKPRDPSYGGNQAWGISRQNQIDTSRYYQDEIAKYRKAHRQQAWCKDGSVSGKGSGACSGHGGLLKRN